MFLGGRRLAVSTSNVAKLFTAIERNVTDPKSLTAQACGHDF
jgi:hypothetical protein